MKEDFDMKEDFEKWFDERFPETKPHLVTLRLSYKEIAKDAWEASLRVLKANENNS